MFKNYFVTAFRNLGKSKFFSFLNILGLSVGIAVAIMAGIYAFNELSVDKFNPYYDNIYRIEVGDWFHVPAPIISIIRSQMPGLEAVAPIDRRSISITVNQETQGIDAVFFTNADFIKIFPLQMLSGDAESAFEDPWKLLVSESEALRLFGTSDLVGKQITIDKGYNYTIAGVFLDFPDNSVINFNVLSSWENRKLMSGQSDYFENWSNWNYQTYVRLSDKRDPQQETIEQFNASFNEFIQETQPERSGITFNLRHLKDIYFFKDLNKNDFCNHGNMLYLILFSTSALLTLVIAIINFINQTTARATLRSTEIGIRKVNGARRSDLIRQFIGEAFVVAVISFIVSLILIEILLPYFNGIIGKKLVFNPITNPEMLLFVLTGIVLIALLTGLYPAFFMSSFNTIFILKKSMIRGKNGLLSRRILMIIQFVITTSLILATLIIYSQMRFMVHKDLGYDKEHILYFAMNSETKQHQKTIKEDLLKSVEIEQVAIVHSLPGNFYMEWGRDLDDGTGVNFFSVPCDEDFIPMLDLEIVEGRNFDPNIESDKNGYIVNEAFVRKYNLKNPLSVQIDIYNIIGVVKDFTFQSLHHYIKPMAFSFFTDWSWYVAVKVHGSDIEAAKNTIQAICSQFTESKINIRFLDDMIAAKYVKDKQFSVIFSILSVLAILVSSLGLLGLITFEANRRTKEIGIRKVLGASPLEIINLFNKEIIILISISSLIAWIVGYLWLNNWLQNFAFRISIGIGYFIASTLITTAVALITFSFLSFRAANANPVDSIKYE